MSKSMNCASFGSPSSSTSATAVLPSSISSRGFQPFMNVFSPSVPALHGGNVEVLSQSAARSDLRSPRIALGSVSGSRTAIHSVATTSPVVPLVALIHCSIATPQLLTAVSQFRLSTTSQVAVNMCIVPPTLARFGKLAMVDWTS
eukprot:scaffold76728_cov36-Attheya_sp.AAC.3